MEKEKVVLPKFNVETYLKDGDAVIDKLKDVEAAANKIHDKGYENIFLLGMGGTYDELEPIQYIMNKYSEVEVHLSNAAELNVLGNKRLNKKSIVITASASGDTKEIVEAVEWIVKEGIDVMAFTKPETPLGKLATMIVTAPVTTGQCEYSYLMFDVLALRLLNRRGEFPKYDDFVAQTKNIFHDLVGIREKFDERADEIAKQYALAPYSIFVGSGALWGETVLFSMCILEEMQWVRTRAVSSPDFFHGTLELVEKDVITLKQMVEKMCLNPAKILGLDRGTLQKGHPADVIIVDTEQEYAIDKNKFVSKGHNTPFDGWKVKGKVLYTICDGKIVFKNQEEKES